jgi:hypothetical protein
MHRRDHGMREPSRRRVDPDRQVGARCRRGGVPSRDRGARGRERETGACEREARSRERQPRSRQREPGHGDDLRRAHRRIRFRGARPDPATRLGVAVRRRRRRRAVERRGSEIRLEGRGWGHRRSCDGGRGLGGRFGGFRGLHVGDRVRSVIGRRHDRNRIGPDGFRRRLGRNDVGLRRRGVRRHRRRTGIRRGFRRGGRSWIDRLALGWRLSRLGRLGRSRDVGRSRDGGRSRRFGRSGRFGGSRSVAGSGRLRRALRRGNGSRRRVERLGRGHRRLGRRSGTGRRLGHRPRRGGSGRGRCRHDHGCGRREWCGHGSHRSPRQEGQRIDVALGVRRDPDPEVDRGIGRVRRRADGADRRALADGCSAGDRDRAEVDEGHRIAVGSRDRDDAAAVRHLAGERDGAAGRREHALADRTADVDAAVLSAGVRLGVVEDKRSEHRAARRPGPGVRRRGGAKRERQGKQHGAAHRRTSVVVRFANERPKLAAVSVVVKSDYRVPR